MSESINTLPNVRRVLTGHKPDGKATVILDETVTPKLFRPGAPIPNSFQDIYRTETVPVSIDSEVITGSFADETKTKIGLVESEGSSFTCVDLGPGTVSPLHRTVSLDYAVVTKGSIILELDDGTRTTLNEGDTVCQRGTMHRSINESNEWTRIFFVVLGAKPIVVNGKELGETGL